MCQNGETLNYCYKYPRPSVTTDCVIFGCDGMGLSVLLVERGAPPYKGCWAFPGGFLKMDECAEEGASRELWEETGLREARVHQFHAFTAPDRDPRERVITIAYYALVRTKDVRGGDDAADARWFGLGDVPPLAFDHALILQEAIVSLRRQIFFEPIVFEYLPEVFTKEALCSLYELIMGTKNGGHRFFEWWRHSGALTPVCEGSDRKDGRSVRFYKYDARKNGSPHPLPFLEP